MTARECDVAIIGAGPGGYAAAIRLGQLGRKVILIEKDEAGGECLNRGCIPSKALISAATIVTKAGDASKLGITFQEPDVDMAKLQTWKSGVVKKLVKGLSLLFKANGVEYLKGSARFVSSQKLEVETDEGSVIINAQTTIVATGSRCAGLPSIPQDGERIIGSREALALLEIPKHLVVIGGGYIGLELGSMYAKLGSQLTVVELTDRILSGIDPELVAFVSKNLRRSKAKVFLNSKASRVERAGEKVSVTVETPDGEETMDTDVVLVTVGRCSITEQMGFENTKIKLSERGYVQVDEKQQTADGAIYAVGDVTGGMMLAHKATHEGIVAAEVIAGLDVSLKVRAMPAVVFTDPEIATVGLTKAQAEEKGIEVTTGRFPFMALGRALAANDYDGFSQVVAEKASGKIIGVQIVGPEASNLIGEGALAVENGLTLEQLADTIHAHPTFPEGLMEAAEVALGKALHWVNKG